MGEVGQLNQKFIVNLERNRGRVILLENFSGIHIDNFKNIGDSQIELKINFEAQ